MAAASLHAKGPGLFGVGRGLRKSNFQRASNKRLPPSHPATKIQSHKLRPQPIPPRLHASEDAKNSRSPRRSNRSRLNRQPIPRPSPTNPSQNQRRRPHRKKILVPPASLPALFLILNAILLPRSLLSPSTFSNFPHSLVHRSPTHIHLFLLLILNKSHRRMPERNQSPAVFLRQTVLHIRNTWIRQHQRPAKFQQRRPLDRLHVPPKMSVVPAQIAIPPSARPRLNFHRHRHAIHPLIVRSNLLKQSVERHIHRRPHMNFLNDLHRHIFSILRNRNHISSSNELIFTNTSCARIHPAAIIKQTNFHPYISATVIPNPFFTNTSPTLSSRIPFRGEGSAFALALEFSPAFEVSSYGRRLASPARVTPAETWPISFGVTRSVILCGFICLANSKELFQSLRIPFTLPSARSLTRISCPLQ